MLLNNKKKNPRFKLTGLDPLVNWAEDCKSMIDNMKCPLAILGDPRADSGGEGKFKQAQKYGTKEK